MTEHERYSLYQRCFVSIDRAMARYNWVLLDREEFARQVFECLQAGGITDTWRAAVHIYCRTLHKACTGEEGKDRQERAFIELHRYLYDISFYEIKDLPYDARLDCVHETLLRIWQRLPEYRVPGAFLAAAAFELRNVLRPWWTRPIPDTQFDEQVEVAEAPHVSDPLARALESELRHEIRAGFEEAFRHNPRARQQLEAVWLKFIVGMDDQAISSYLGKPIASIHVLRSRGLSHLRAEPFWKILAQQFGLDEVPPLQSGRI